MRRRPPRSTQSRSSAASDVYKRQVSTQSTWGSKKNKQRLNMAESVEKAHFANTPLLFGKWSYQDITVEDICFKDYIAVSQTKVQVYLPHTAGRYQIKRFRKATCPIVERLVGSLQFHGRNTGKKQKAIRIVRQAFELIHILTKENPIQVFVNALQNCGAREDATRIGTGGNARRQAVDVSPLRRVNTGIYYMIKGTRDSTFRSLRNIAECLADEIINAAKNSPNSAAVRKKDEVEKVAKGDR
eukprot:TRINITY_DN50_c0_g1_i11.p1 TRINITY_DN50_c0_g1~~TRINITY_DN50_c0_g1_i11.p1  ORF type:complete len:243 (+),score=99.35 TRINITY_DN50_c0_g1_i11:97-825(+)